MEIKDLMELLSKNKITSSIKYDDILNKIYLDLETNAKSHLYLYEDGILRGRYNYEVQIDLSENIDDVITKLCYEFADALHGRSYYQAGWGELCRQKGIKLETYW